MTLSGDLLAAGKDAHGIFAQSIGSDGYGNASIDLLEGIVRGGTGECAGVQIEHGAANTRANAGTVTSVLGIAGNAIGGGVYAIQPVPVAAASSASSSSVISKRLLVMSWPS